MTPPNSNNGWQEWGQHVRSELERQNELLASLSKQLNAVHVEIAQLKVKAGIWGLIGASIPIAVILVVNAAKG